TGSRFAEKPSVVVPTRSVPPGFSVCELFVSLLDPVHAAETRPTTMIAERSGFEPVGRDPPSFPPLAVMEHDLPSGRDGSKWPRKKRLPPGPQRLRRRSVDGFQLTLVRPVECFVKAASRCVGACPTGLLHVVKHLSCRVPTVGTRDTAARM